MEEFLHFITRQIKYNRKIFFAFIGFVLTMIFVVMLAYSKLHIINCASSEKLALACMAFNQGNQRKGITLLDEVISKFSKTQSAYQARLIKADMLIEIRAYRDALNILTEVVKNGKPNYVKPFASLRIIYVYDSQKDYSNAIFTSKKFIDKYPDHFLIKDIYLNLAEYYFLSGLKDECVKIFKKILIKFPATQEAERAQNRLNNIKKQQSYKDFNCI
jgi:tetratricopeptide (TPR) repeat protein